MASARRSLLSARIHIQRAGAGVRHSHHATSPQRRDRQVSPKTGGGKAKRPVPIWLGTGLIAGAADDDPSAIGTYASVGARYGLSALWIAPLLLPMMYVVMYVSGKLGRVYGKGLFGALVDRFPRETVYPLAFLAVAGNLIEAAANLGGIGAAVALLVPMPPWSIVLVVATAITAVQIVGSYALLRRLFRWLTLALFAYIGAAVLARPDPIEVLRGTFIPTGVADLGFVAMLVACVGTSLSAYIYTWQSNQQVEERVENGARTPEGGRHVQPADLQRVRRDALAGVAYSNIILYFIIMATGATLHAAGRHDIDSAAQAASALEPVAGPAARWLFALGIVGVGFLAFPVMTTGAAYDIVQVLRAPGSLHRSPIQAPLFYSCIVLATLAAVLLNLLGFNPMRALVWSGIVQGLSVPPLLVMMMIMTGDRQMMGAHANSLTTRILGWGTAAVTGLLALGLAVFWIMSRR
ncbi:NRAMP family divalent metal transporter [Luteibacter sp. 9135]|uniref:NRAMP family divalent metal transporter n=1 Tax=Luteibacter sp. 9135 TaxID=1500893 RepID=UPI001EFD5B1F|nr:divalent metal cation transporter [Luteibacter sp. 9135]